MRLTIGRKLISGFLLGALLLGVISTITYVSMNRIDDSYSNLLNRRANIMMNVKEIQSNVNWQSDSLRGYLLIQGQKTLDELNQSNSKITILINKSSDLVEGQDDINALKKLGELNQQFKQTADKAVSLYQSNPKDAIDLGTTELTSLIRDMRTITDAIADGQLKLMTQGTAENKDLVDQVNQLVIWISIGGTAGAIVIGYVVSRIITKPIVAIKNIAERIAEGDLTTEVHQVKHRDEIGDLAKAFHQMTVNLRNVILHVGTDAEQVGASAEQLSIGVEQTSKATQQITQAIQQVASGAETQTSGAEESAAALEEMAIGIQRIAENSSIVSETAVNTMKNAESGSQSIQQAVEQMNFIFQSVQTSDSTIKLLYDRSHEIEQILEVIKSIAIKPICSL